MIALIFGNPARLLAGTAFAALWTATAVNALWLQDGPHPAPFVQQLPWQGEAGVEPAPQASAPRTAPQYDQGLVQEIQEALAGRGFYRGEIDGLYGPGTAAAIESYLRAAGEEGSAEPTPALLARIQLSSVEAPPLPPGDPRETSEAVSAPAKAAPADLAPDADPRIARIQQALADLGYRPGPVDGRWGSATSGAISRFEEDRDLPVTGEVNQRVLAELSRLSDLALR